MPISAPLLTSRRNGTSRQKSAAILRSDEEAIEAAQRLAEMFRPGASERDRQRALPHQEIELISQSGLYGATVPKEYGGAEIRAVTVAEVFRILAASDASLGQIPQNHVAFVECVRGGTPKQQAFYFGRFLKGERLGNALSEAQNKKGMLDYKTRLTKVKGGYRINGSKAYCTGAIFAHWVPIFTLDEKNHLWMAYVKRDTPGLEVLDDWSSFGQRTTASGTIHIDNIFVTRDQLFPRYQWQDHRFVGAAWGQLPHAAIDVGIAEEAMADGIRFIHARSRPWRESGLEKNSDEPMVIQKIGELQFKLDAARLFLRHAGGLVDVSRANPTEETILAAAFAVAEARVAADRAALDITSELFELCGTKSTFAEFNLDRHWRNARTHTLHDPIRWKIQYLGNYHLNGIKPPKGSLV